jgi:GNAT acetyltransferase-like protein
MIHVLRTDDPRWDDWLDRTNDDIYHRSGYHRFHERTAAASARLVVIEQGAQALMWPYLERQVSQVPELSDVSAIDLDSVHGYPGPLYIGTRPTDAFLAMAWRALEAHWREQGVVSVFTRFHPLLGNAELALRFPGSAADGVRLLGETVSMDLRLNEEEALREYKRKLRRTITVGRRAGMTTRLDPGWRDLEAFSAIYQATMRRNGADSRYSFSIDDFRQLRTELGSELHLFVTELDGQPVSATLVTEHRGIVQSHIGGSADGTRPLSPEAFELDEIRRWASQRGNSVLHLGGGRGAASDSLFFFKSRFSGRRHPFHTGSWVIDRDAYRELTSMRAARAQTAGLEVEDQFFPMYRAPLRKAPGER